MAFSSQIALDKTTENLQQAHVETEQIIHQWENTIQQMKQRDGEIHGSALVKPFWIEQSKQKAMSRLRRNPPLSPSIQQLAETNQVNRERNDTLTEMRHLQESQVNDNTDKEKKLAATNRQTAKLRLDFKQQESNYVQMQDEVRSKGGRRPRACFLTPVCPPVSRRIAITDILDEVTTAHGSFVQDESMSLFLPHLQLKNCKAVMDRTTSNVHSMKCHIRRVEENIHNNNQKWVRLGRRAVSRPTPADQ